MNIKPIKTKKDYQSALKRVDALMSAKKGTEEGDELDVLVTLIEVYEDKHYQIDSPDPIEAIKHVMEALGMNRRELNATLGSASRASEILNRRRKLSLPMIRELNASMGIPAQALIKDYKLRA